MLPGVGIVERAFQLARTGYYSTTSDIERALRAEGYVVLNGLLSRSLRRQLLTIMREAKALSEADRIPKGDRISGPPEPDLP